MFSAIGEILSRIVMWVTIDRLKEAVQVSPKSLGADHVGCSWKINIEDPSYTSWRSLKVSPCDLPLNAQAIM